MHISVEKEVCFHVMLLFLLLFIHLFLIRNRITIVDIEKENISIQNTQRRLFYIPCLSPAGFLSLSRLLAISPGHRLAMIPLWCSGYVIRGEIKKILKKYFFLFFFYDKIAILVKRMNQIIKLGLGS